jgi:uncharacterized membrane protein YjgN (DUF898 family)
MTSRFEFTLRGRDWWKQFLLYWVLFLVLYVPLLLLQQWLAPQEKPLLYFLVTMVSVVGITILSAGFTIVFLRLLLPKLSVAGRAFTFRGSVGRFIGLSVGRMALSIVTLMVYLPWYMRRAMAYLVSESTFDGVAPEFRGKGGRLFVIMLLSLWLPAIAVAIAAGMIAGLAMAARGGAGAAAAAGPGTQSMLVTGATTVVLLLCMVPFAYLAYKWYVNVGWKDAVVRWKTTFWRSCFFILGQGLLTVVTLGIYGPAAFLRLYRYFVGRTVIERDGREVGRLGFEGSIGRGFGLLWGQGLLALITAGVYLPWAYAKVGRWLLGATFHEGEETPA